MGLKPDPHGNTNVLELSLANVDQYLRQNGHIDGGQRADYELLGGGISNTVLKVMPTGDCFVVKQSLPKLRVAQDWFFDRRRIFVERDCMAALADLLPTGSVPEVKFSDEPNFVLGMSCAPDGGENWKESLLRGSTDLQAATWAAKLLALLHCESHTRQTLLDSFRDQSLLIQGRIDPYHRTVAKQHPDLEPVISAEVERLLSTRQVLVHGDYSPKNIVLYPGAVFVLDFEVAHYGDPAFDVAFCLTHLVLKAIHFAPDHARYLACARRFWDTYRSAVGRTFEPALESSVVAELGCLMLARIDGKSRVEYITDEPTREVARQLARNLLLVPPPNPAEAVARLEAEIAKSSS